ncbi:MAG: alpha-galactosidase [Candidatus Marinimicrobia bacterium]|nr:alpha-galactosidase [Candidatus Neomarinimicrobiota bacterium]MCF7830225.1 alpha-galactosidase [Candidatus Neomarinimicrobiota bacterium]MCF7880842.1 alpha-galactosidase [Candidatus Neomarinimicrobiota bacterium]
MRKQYWTFGVIALSLTILFGCASTQQQSKQSAGPAAVVEGQNLRVEFNKQLYSRIVATYDGQDEILGEYSPSETVTLKGKEISEFTFQDVTAMTVEADMGAGNQYKITGVHAPLQKTVTVTVYDGFPDMAVFDVQYTNTSGSPVEMTRWANNHYTIDAKWREDTPFWSFQDASYASRPDWVLSLTPGFEQENYMGMNASDYGNGTPVVDVWRKDVGLAVGHLEIVPKLVSLPVAMPDSSHAMLGVTYSHNATTLPSGETMNTFTTFASVHPGDYFSSLRSYRDMMLKRGIKFPETPETAYEPIWCAWGYGRDFTIDQVTASLDKVQEMGYDWAVLDDGWQIAEGDWRPNKKHFPEGEKSMKAFVDKIKDHDLKAKLWWAPLAADSGSWVMEEHPEYLLENKDGSLQHISWWDSYYLCPADEDVQQYTKELVQKIIGEWGYAGLKIDGQHLNGAPPCYNPKHNHARPEESVEAIPEFFKIIYEAALEIDPNAVVEICPCGTGYNFFTMPYMNQSVASDPTSSWQIRLKGKTFKALMGPSAPYYGDHVELSTTGEDFASTAGVGGVIGTKFTVLPNSKRDSTFYLNERREQKWAQWMDIYKSRMLPTGEYRGELYDIGFGAPEGHAVEKNGKMYYAFYAEHWDGSLELRGLKSGVTYQVTDYVNGTDFGVVTGPTEKLNTQFTDYLLLEATPQ